MNLLDQTRKIRPIGSDDRLSDMLVMGEGSDLRIMGGIIVAEDQTTGDVLPVVAIIEPGEFTFVYDERLTDFEQGIVRQTQPDAQVPPIDGQELCAIVFDADASPATDGLPDFQEIGLKGSHPTAFKRALSSWRRPTDCWSSPAHSTTSAASRSVPA